MSKGYREDGEKLENLSAFTGGGFESMPPVYHDTQRIHDLGNEKLWPTPLLEERLGEYGRFIQKDNMPRAQQAAKRIVDHLLFETAYRDGVYQEKQFNEDELCNGNE